MMERQLLESAVGTSKPPRTLQPVVAGRSWTRATSSDALEFATGEKISIGVLDARLLKQLLNERSADIGRTELHEIVSFLYNVGQNWKRRDYTRRTVYERNLVKYLGYSEKAARTEADWIALYLSSSFRLYDIVATELGEWRIVDDWIPREEAMVRAFARGTVLHLVPGNVPQSAVVSILRALVTKNRSIVKVSAADPFTAMALAHSLADVSALHPVTQAVSVVYWPTKDAAGLGSELAHSADVIAAWGGREAIDWARGAAGSDTEVVAFGPKESLAVIAADADLNKAAEAVAVDVCLYDQRACFSTRRVLVQESCAEQFAARLAAALHKLERILPPGVAERDALAIRALDRAHALFMGQTVCGSPDESWAVVVGNEKLSGNHPLGRTVYLTTYRELADIYCWVDSNTQTVCVYPWTLSSILRDECARRGAARIVECGLSNVFRVGGTHDAMYPLQRMVRIVANELPSRNRVKGINVAINQTEFLEHDRFLEFIP